MRRAALLSCAALCAIVASCAQAPVRPVAFAEAKAKLPDGPSNVIACEANEAATIRWRVLEYRIGSRSHIYFEQERRESDGAWRTHGVGASDQLDLGLAQWEVDQVSCRPKGDFIEVWVDVFEHPWRRREFGGFVIDVHPDFSIAVEEWVITGPARW